MNYRIISLIIMAIYYSFYIAKLLILNKKSIKTNQAGIGNKPKKVIIVERIMSIATVSTIVIEVYSILFTTLNILDGLRIIGIVFGILAIIFFALATITMKDSWRVGIPEEKTSLISTGIYKWSRNPAFVGFDLLYISICLIYFNLPLLLISIFAGTMLHLQILQEEKHMQNMFGKEYEEYKKHTLRYFGRR